MIAIAFLLFVLGCAAVYLGTIDAAFSALMRLSLRRLAERDSRADSLGRYLERPLLLFVPVRLLLGLIAVLATVLLGQVTGVQGVRAVVFLVVLVAVFIVVCEHLVPLVIVRRDPERLLEWLLPSFAGVVRLVQPITAALAGTLRPERGAPPPGGNVDEEQSGTEAARPAGEGGAHAGSVERESRRLLQSIVEFGDTLVREVMTPRPDIVAIRSDATLDELRALCREQEYSRIPVYTDNLDNIVGFVFVKDLIQLDTARGDERRITELMRPAYFVPETKPVAELLKEFQRRQVQSAIVVDEYGGTAGLATIEDLLEEIVGEIRDEYDEESEPILDEGHGSFVFSGKVDIDRVAERLNVEIARKGFETLGGYLLAHLGRVPGNGETFDIDGLSVQVLEAERRRVQKVRIRRLAVTESSQ